MKTFESNVLIGRNFLIMSVLQLLVSTFGFHHLTLLLRLACLLPVGDSLYKIVSLQRANQLSETKFFKFFSSIVCNSQNMLIALPNFALYFICGICSVTAASYALNYELLAML
jgi:hypothetical protein